MWIGPSLADSAGEHSPQHAWEKPGEKHREDSRENKWVAFLLRYRYEGVAARGG